MNNLIAKGGCAIGALGVAVTVASGVWRVSGHYYLAGFEAMTLFVGGMGLILIGCYAMLHVLTTARNP